MAVAFDDIQTTEQNPTPTPGIPSALSFSDAEKLGNGNQITYTEPKPKVEPGLGQRVGEDITKPFIEMQHTIGSSLGWLGDNLRDNAKWGSLGDRLTRMGLIMRERAEKNLTDNYSNFTPNLMDKMVGVVPSLAAIVGAAYFLPEEAVVIGVAATMGVGAGMESYQKAKQQGYGTNMANLIGATVGTPTGAVAAFGFGKIAELAQPWLSKVMAASIAKIVGNTMAGATAGAAMTATEGTAELATGIEPWKGKESLVNLLGNAAESAIIMGVGGGAMGLPYVLKQHAAIEKGFTDLGLTPDAAKQAANDLLGQGAHVLMDKLEATGKFTPNELSRIDVQLGEIKGDVRPSVLDRRGIPMDSFYPPLKDNVEPEEVGRMYANNKYVPLEPVKLRILPTDKATGKAIVEEYTGALNRQFLRGNYLAEDMKLLAPQEQESIFWRRHFDPETIQEAIKNPEKFLKGELEALRIQTGDAFEVKPEEFAKRVKYLESLKPQLEKALAMSTSAQRAAEMATQYFDEAGKVAQSLGTIRELRDNYVSNRLYKPEPPRDYVKVQGKGGLPQFSSHSLERIYENPFQAIAAGKEFATTNQADLLAVHNQELAVVNHARQMADAMSDMKPFPLGRWMTMGRVPEGWTQVGKMTKEIPLKNKEGEPVLDEQNNQIRAKYMFVAPKGIADALKPIVDPDWLKQFGFIRGVQKVQGVTKTGLLSYSFFHHKALSLMAFSSERGWKTMADLVPALKDGVMQTQDFRDTESFFTKMGGETTAVHDVEDIMRGLEQKDDWLGKVLKAPVAKQLGQISDANSRLLFDGMQRYMKVMTFERNMAAWDAKFPEATEVQREEAARGFAKTTNAVFGGLNWANLGITKTQLSVLRLLLLAPDWLTSAVKLANYAVTDWGASPVKALAGMSMDATAGQQARGTLVKAVLGGYLFGNAMNYLLHGRFMGDNKEGHKNEIEVAPDVYIMPYSGGPGEVVKVLSDIVESGVGKGISRFGQGKLSPIMGAGLMAVTGVNYYGGNIWKGDSEIAREVNGIWNIASKMLPVPIGLGGMISYQNREDEKTPAGWAWIASGFGRFSKPSAMSAEARMKEDAIMAFRKGDQASIDRLIASGDLSQEQADQWQQESQESDIERKMRHARIENAIEIFKKASAADKAKIGNILQDKFDRYQDSKASPNAKARIAKMYQKLQEGKQ